MWSWWWKIFISMLTLLSSFLSTFSCCVYHSCIRNSTTFQNRFEIVRFIETMLLVVFVLGFFFVFWWHIIATSTKCSPSIENNFTRFWLFNDELNWKEIYIQLENYRKADFFLLFGIYYYDSEHILTSTGYTEGFQSIVCTNLRLTRQSLKHLSCIRYNFVAILYSIMWRSIVSLQHNDVTASNVNNNEFYKEKTAFAMLQVFLIIQCCK